MTERAETPSSPLSQSGPSVAPPNPGRARRVGLALAAGALVTLVAILAVPLTSCPPLRERANRFRCQANLKAIGIAARIYRLDYAGAEEPTIDWLVNAGHLTQDQVICPSSGLARSSYVLQLPAADGEPFVYEPKSSHGGVGGNVVFGDGHVAFLRGEEYDRVIRPAPYGENAD